jgi:PKD repeat protein
MLRFPSLVDVLRARGRALLHLLFLVPVLLVTVVPATAAAAPGARPPLPALQLGQRQRGEAAIRALGARLAEVAAHYRMTPERFAKMLREDSNAWIDAQGRLLFIDSFIQPPADGNRRSAALAPVAALADTFNLHSRPGAERVIYLDFTGYVATNSAWSGGTIDAVPYDIDGDPTTFSDAERAAIQSVWQRVAEDFAPFDVDVTTEEPPAPIGRVDAADTSFGTRVVITRNTFFDCFCGGVAFIGTFDLFVEGNPEFFQPAWVFFEALGLDEKNIAEAASHEAGHNLGLIHDGTTFGLEYYGGHGSGETGWAPIMGVGYSQNLTQWSRGEYPEANNQEDDIEVMVANGAPLRADDIGSSRETAQPLAGSAASGRINVAQDGVIEREEDVDVFSFVSAGGSVQLRVDPLPIGPNLDIVATLYDAAGRQVARSNPAEELEAVIDVTLPAGSYFLAIDGTGKGDLATGYSDYASLGQYRISGSYPVADARPPVARATAFPTSGRAPLNVHFTGLGSGDPDGSIESYRWDFGDGKTGTGILVDHTYTAAGNYTATLTVRDEQGLTDTDSVVISVVPGLKSVHVHKIALRLATSLGGRVFQCVAKVTVRSGADKAAPGATVKGHWSGVTSENDSATTNSEGIATLRSPWTRKRGTCAFTTDEVTLPGHGYVPAENEETSDSLNY